MSRIRDGKRLSDTQVGFQRFHPVQGILRFFAFPPPAELQKALPGPLRNLPKSFKPAAVIQPRW